jgi:hypothetical protein
MSFSYFMLEDAYMPHLMDEYIDQLPDTDETALDEVDTVL